MPGQPRHLETRGVLGRREWPFGEPDSERGVAGGVVGLEGDGLVGNAAGAGDLTAAQAVGVGYAA